jgi:hypothetical protein
MAYDNHDDFFKVFKKIYSEEADKTWVTAWKVYNNARKNPNHFCLMGRLSDRDAILGTNKIEAGASATLLSDDNKTANFYVTDEKGPGNVLKIDTWSLGINDAWVLGGIHGDGTTSSTFNFFGLGIVDTKDHAKIEQFVRDILRSDRYYVTVTAREMLGLISAQYRFDVSHGALILTPTTYSAKPDLTFEAYNTAVKNFKNEASIRIIKQRLQSAGQC